jgi:N-acetylmuramoyl-L-alanine amidase
MTIIERASPNQSVRSASISAIVIHDTAGKTAESALTWFESPTSQVSSHYVIDKDGSVYRCVPDARKAWHAGESVLHGVRDVNQYSIGIELVDDNDGDLYPAAQMLVVEELTAVLSETYQIPLNRIVGHQHISVPLGRKVDPGKDFDWFGFLASVAGLMGPDRPL